LKTQDFGFHTFEQFLAELRVAFGPMEQGMNSRTERAQRSSQFVDQISQQPAARIFQRLQPAGQSINRLK
jgi:hypothetical protein